MNYEILSIETIEKIERLEKENKVLRKELEILQAYFLEGNENKCLNQEEQEK